MRIVFVAFDRLESILKPATIWMDSKLTSNTGELLNIFDQNWTRFYLFFFTDSSLQNNGTEKQVEPRKRILNSKVISASLGKGRHIQLSQPIRLVLRHLIMENVTNPSCVFWNYIDQYVSFVFPCKCIIGQLLNYLKLIEFSHYVQK